VIFFNNAGFLNMCGHGTIGLIASLAWLGRISRVHLIETPVGDVSATLHEDGSVSVQNVPAPLANRSALKPRTVRSRRYCLGRQLVLPRQRSSVRH
jgi:proline racemase